MSASLVGSEMCIRDRTWLRPLWRRLLLPRGAGRLGQRSSRLRGSGTVSYTHLTLPTICSV
eukprot:1276366-Alexandrium_andersonii.AAC.1